MTAPSDEKSRAKAERKEADARLRRLTRAKAALLKARSNLTRCLVETAELVESTKTTQEWTKERTKEWLVSEIGMSPREATTAISLKACLGDNAQATVDAGLQSEVLDRLVDSDEEVRCDFFSRLQSGRSVDAELVEKLGQDTFLSRLPVGEARDVRRSQTLETAGRIAGPDLTAALEDAASKLLKCLDEVVVYLPSMDCEEPCSEASLLEPIRSSANVTRTLFVILFGDQHADLASMIDLALVNDVQASIAFAWYALRKLETSPLYREDIENSAGHLHNVRPAIEFLAGRRSVAVPLSTERAPVSRANADLTFIDFGAGIGCAALGLQSAGYRTVALYESWRSAFATVQINRPSWPLASEPAAWHLKKLCAQPSY